MRDANGSSVDPEVREAIQLLSFEHPIDRREASAWLVEHASRSRPALIEIVKRRGPDPLVLLALQILGRIGETDDVPLLAGILDGKNPELVWDGAQALAQHPAPQALAALRAGLQSGNSDVVEAAAVALGVRGDESARPDLERLLAHPKETVRYRAIYALRMLGTAPSESILRERLKHEGSEEVRKFIEESLA